MCDFKQPQLFRYFLKDCKVYHPIPVHVITRYRCGQSPFCSCDHVVGGQRKAPMDKSQIGQSPLHKTKAPKKKIKQDKTLNFENTIKKTNTQGAQSPFCSCDHVGWGWGWGWGEKSSMDKSPIRQKLQG